MREAHPESAGGLQVEVVFRPYIGNLSTKPLPPAGVSRR
jgi:hypothetical protein